MHIVSKLQAQKCHKKWEKKCQSWSENFRQKPHVFFFFVHCKLIPSQFPLAGATLQVTWPALLVSLLGPVAQFVPFVFPFWKLEGAPRVKVLCTNLYKSLATFTLSLARSHSLSISLFFIFPLNSFAYSTHSKLTSTRRVSLAAFGEFKPF